MGVPHLRVRHRAPVGSEDAQEWHIDTDLVEFSGHGPDAFGSIPVETGDEARHHADTAVMERLDPPAIVGNLVLAFPRVLQ